MKIVIGYIDTAIQQLNQRIERYSDEGPTHEIPEMVTWYEEKANAAKYEVQELEFIRQLIKREAEMMRVFL